MKKIIVSTFLILFCATMVFASKIDGTWEGSYETDYGTQDVTVTYKVDGNKITGYFTSDNGKLDINEGKVNGNEFEYTFDWDIYTIIHKCKLEEDKIKVKWNVEGYEGEFVLKKSE